MSCDPEGSVDDTNLYRYSRCEPIVLVDPKGTQPEASTPTKPTPTPRAASKKKSPQYDIAFVKGDAEWTQSDMEQVKWALAKLTKKELEALRGIKFRRWTDIAGRQKVEPRFQPVPGENGLFEWRPQESVFQISLYNSAFAELDPEVKSTFYEGAKDVPFGANTILHEIGHAMASTIAREFIESYRPPRKTGQSLRLNITLHPVRQRKSNRSSAPSKKG